MKFLTLIFCCLVACLGSNAQNLQILPYHSLVQPDSTKPVLLFFDTIPKFLWVSDTAMHYGRVEIYRFNQKKYTEDSIKRAHSKDSAQRYSSLFPYNSAGDIVMDTLDRYYNQPVWQITGYEVVRKDWACCDPTVYSIAAYYWQQTHICYLDADKHPLKLLVGLVFDKPVK